MMMNRFSVMMMMTWSIKDLHYQHSSHVLQNMIQQRQQNKLNHMDGGFKFFGDSQ